MTLEKFKRLLILSIFGGLCAGGLLFIVFTSLEPSRSNEPNISHLKTATLGASITFISIIISWIIMFLRKPSTPRRGIKYGSITGLFALFILMMFISYQHMFPLEKETEISTLIIIPLIMFMFAFILGGFLAPLLGAFLGYLSVLGLEEK